MIRVEITLEAAESREAAAKRLTQIAIGISNGRYSCIYIGGKDGPVDELVSVSDLDEEVEF